jgi:hypothetical protein
MLSVLVNSHDLAVNAYGLEVNAPIANNPITIFL